MAEIKINISAYNDFINRTVQPYLLAKAHEIANEARINSPVGATGELSNSISVERGEKGSVKILVRSEHAGFVHQGTGPQHIPGARAPYFPRLRKGGLIIWSESKGVNPYKVAYGISKSGTPANPFLSNAITKVLGANKFRWIKLDLEEV